MLSDFTGAEKVYIACGYTDLRKGIDGLATLVQSQFQLDPFTNTLFLFCGRRKDRIKALYWEGNGFVLLYKRLENGSFQNSNVLTYNWSNDKHDITGMVGHEYVSQWSRNFSAGANQFPNDDIGLGDLSLGTPTTPTSSVNYDNKLLSFFARANYSLMDKYLFTASVRADGSSKFGANNKWGYFPAVSAAWRLGEEAFIKDLNIFSDLAYRLWFGR